MRAAGDVDYCSILKDWKGRSKGCAFVSYRTKKECEAAVELLDNTCVGSTDRKIYLRHV